MKGRGQAWEEEVRSPLDLGREEAGPDPKRLVWRAGVVGGGAAGRPYGLRMRLKSQARPTQPSHTPGLGRGKAPEELVREPGVGVGFLSMYVSNISLHRASTYCRKVRKCS